jgi:hypothetical protein
MTPDKPASGAPVMEFSSVPRWPRFRENYVADIDEAAQRQAIKEENRRLRYLRFMVDLALLEIRSGSFSLSQAQQVVENIRSQALMLFPGKESAFDIIYRPRLQRAIAETFQLH